MIFNQIIGGKKLPSLDNPGDANDILSGKQLIDQFGNPITGTIPIKTSSNITINGRTITVPSGYYASQVSKSIATVTQATPSISVSSSGLITASSTQSEGYVSSGTKTSTKQLPTKDSSDLTVSGETVSVPAGYYADDASKSVKTTTQATPSISVNDSGLITASSVQKEGYVTSGTKTSTQQLPLKTSSDVTVNGSSITVPSGYYTSQVSKSVSTAAQATPSISVSSSGLITASSTQSEGYVSAGTKSSTKQLSTQSGTTITPSVIQKTAITAGKYTTGPIYVAGSSNLIASNIKSGVNIFGVVGNLSSPKIWSGTNLTSSFGYGSFTITFYDIPFISKVYAGCFDVYLVVNGRVDPTSPVPLVISPNYVDRCYVRFRGAYYVGKYNMSTNGNVITFSSIGVESNNYSGSAVQTGSLSVNYLVYE